MTLSPKTTICTSVTFGWQLTDNSPERWEINDGDRCVVAVADGGQWLVASFYWSSEHRWIKQRQNAFKARDDAFAWGWEVFAIGVTR